MNNPKKVLEALIAEGNNADNPERTRKILLECADWIEKVVVGGVRPKLVNIPFSNLFEAQCGACSSPLLTEGKYCERCGKLIDWSSLY